VMDSHLESQFQFGSNSIYARDKNRVREFRFVDGKQSTETADLTEHAAGEGLVSKILDPLFGAVGAVDVDASVGISDGGSFRRVVGHRVSPYL